MKRAFKISLYVVIVLGMVWIGLTLWVQQPGEARLYQRNENSVRSMWIIYDPDPIYDLDRQIAEALADTWAQYPWQVNVATVAAMPDNVSGAEVFVFIANTYNWRPDWAVTKAIDRCELTNKKCFAIALGAGSTEDALTHLIERLKTYGAQVLDGKSFWLLRPNDEQRMEADNVPVALDVARAWMNDHIHKQQLSDSLQRSTPQ